ncbi:DUF1648 domain-containing protein [Arthrobacter sp. JSM 101049]|uniref:DUF1648 domain-containing protein n=1 Tax=Arthrobacter sp. JSM 101049 TaxID=929097 RepID=UPI003568B3A3
MGTITEQQLSRGRGLIWLTYPLAVVVLLGTQLYGLSIYAGLPETIPTHWGPSGAPDAFDAKSPGTVFGMLWIGIGMTVLMAFLAAVVPAMSPARADPSAYRRIRREGMIRGTIGGLGLTSVLMALLFSGLALEGWLRPEHVGGWIALLLAGIVLVAIVWAFWLGSRWAQRYAAGAGIEPDADEAAEDRLWLFGGVLYNDPADPRVLVPKREGSGMGLTVNVGPPKGKWAVAVFALLVIGLPVGLSIGFTLGAG